jgi:hypothetical protein
MNSNDQYIGIIELENGRHFTVLKDDTGYKAVSPTNNGYFTDATGYDSIEDLYNALVAMDETSI